MGQYVLRDFLKKSLKIVFIGTVASDVSASQKHYHANPRNYFSKLLHEAGLTDREPSPNEDSLLTRYGFGLTDIAKFEHGNDSRLPRESLKEGRKPLETKIKRFNPKVVCFTSTNADRAFFGRKAKSFRLQQTIEEGS